MKAQVYVDECLPLEVADAISAKRGYRAVHAARDLGFNGRSDEFHIKESRRRDEILVTSNHREFKRGHDMLRQHPGIVMIDPGTRMDVEHFLAAVKLMFTVFRTYRFFAKPALRNDLWERRLVLSTGFVYLEDAGGSRFDIHPEMSQQWYPAYEPRG